MSIVTVALAKQYLQIGHSSEDDVLQVFIDAAEDFVEKYCGIAVYEADGGSVTEYLDGGDYNLWPTSRPVNSVSGIYDTENGNAEETDYRVHGDRILKDDDGEIWDDGFRRWKVEYSGGYSSSDYPSALKKVVLDLVYRWMNGRGGKGRQSAAGYGFNFSDLLDTDMKATLDQHRRGLQVG